MIRIPNPVLPRNFGSRDPEQSKFDGSLTVALVNYLENMATRANGCLPKDGSEAMAGNLSLGGFNLTNVGTATIATLNVTTAFDINNVTVTNSGNLVAGRVKVTTFTADGTFTTDADCLYADVICWGGGGGGGGAPATGAGQVSAGSGGNGGAKASARLTAAQLGASQTVDIGAGGAGNSGANGSAGAVTTFGSLVSAKGGEGGINIGPATGLNGAAAAASQSATGDIRGYTFPGTSFNIIAGNFTGFSQSGMNELGGAILNTNNGNGTAANANTGAGGGGTSNGASQGARTGGTGGSGFCIVYEYLRAA